jgi:membrane associated rhomboid family serine protease
MGGRGDRPGSFAPRVPVASIRLADARRRDAGMRHAVGVSSVAEASSSRATGFRAVAAMVGVMWLVEAVNALDKQRLDAHGIVPRTASGLQGILFAPLLHESFGHLIANTIPFVVLGLTIAFAGAARFLEVTGIVVVVSGLGTWLTAPGSSVTVGASGLVFGYATYLVARAVFSRSLGQLAIGVIVGLLFGGALLWGLAPHTGISWQDHLFGGIGGVLAARLLAAEDARDRQIVMR